MNDSVVIVGAGPVGLMLAHELGLAGVETTVVERHAESDDRTATGLIHARSIDLLEQRGLMERLRQEGEPPVWDQLHFASFWLDMTELGKSHYSVFLLQTRIQRVLSERATDLGVRILRGHELVGLSQDDCGVTARVRSGTAEEEIRCRYLVGCDGENSAVRELAGFPVTRAGPSWYGIVADVLTYEGPSGLGTYREGGGMFGLFGNSDTMYRLMTVEIGVERPPDDQPVTLGEVRASVHRVTGEEPKVEDPQWLYRHGNVTILAEHYRNGRVFLAGDAAHFQFHSAGHAVTIGLQDAVNLGWKMGAHIHGWAPRGLLDSYDVERRPYGRRACVYGRAQMALLDSADGVGALRDVFKDLLGYDDVNRHLIRATTDACYPMENGRCADGSPAHALLGRRVPLVELRTAHGSSHVACALHAGHGVLLDLSGGGEPKDVFGWSDRVDVVVAEPTPEIPASRVLVRPDGHVAWAGENAGDEDGLRKALTTWFGEPSPLREESESSSERR